MSEYFANDPECHDLLPCALRVTQGRRIGGMSHRAACGWSHVHVDSGPVALGVQAAIPTAAVPTTAVPTTASKPHQTQL